MEQVGLAHEDLANTGDGFEAMHIQHVLWYGVWTCSGFGKKSDKIELIMKTDSNGTKSRFDDIIDVVQGTEIWSVIIMY